ncbi:hypothetical protein [Bradyrhizobium sp. CCBAU 51765]|uniref:hypothetical protein n=1 Tax=Bradyrhizobium sp. CCBAU 51765 TaxID=1325102 RepID=UPI001887F51B|nr:hypothetical protein [Bradyrhizobium sp. CCBAU 51765]QOZ06890.1 hypothetical protein XH96_04675 [Bradyrhizobium sp. CCBAU 51765]
MDWMPAEKAIEDVRVIAAPEPRASADLEAQLARALSLRWEEVVLSIGRTQMLSTSRTGLSLAQRDRLVRDVSVAILTQIDIFLERKSDRFTFQTLLEELADEERTSVASKVGAAIADVEMEKSGFRFRANARELTFEQFEATQSKNIPDFVYDSGRGDETTPSDVVAVEAKGSLSRLRATKSRLKNLAKKAYEAQVQAFVGSTANDSIAVTGGCAIAFGATPGNGDCTLRLYVSAPAGGTDSGGAGAAVRGPGLGGARIPRSLSSAANAMQQLDKKHEIERESATLDPQANGNGPGHHRPGRKRRRGPNAHGRIAFANYETVFRLCGAANAALMLRQCLDGAVEREDNPVMQAFYQSSSDDRFLFGGTPFAKCWSPSGYFAIYKPAAEAILEALAANRSTPPDSVTLPELPKDLSWEHGAFAAQADGLTWMSMVRGDFTTKIWNLSSGKW